MTKPADAMKDPLVEAQIERALAPYRGWPPAMLATMREGLEEMYATHPTAIALLEQLRERAAPQQSGEVPVDGAGAQAERKAGGKEGA
jgi:hypothetical protein